MIDPNIALSYHPPTSPADVQAKVIGLQNARMQQAAMQQQMQSAALDLQAKQRSMQDQELLRQSYMDAGGDLKKTTQLAMSRGVGPNSLFAFQKNTLAQLEATAKLTQTQLDNRIKQGDLTAGAFRNFAGQSQQFRDEHYPDFIKQQLTSGNITPEEAQGLLAHGPDSEALKFFANGKISEKQLAEEAIQQQNAQSNATSAAARVQQAKTAADKFTAELPGIDAGNKLKTLEAAGQAPIQPAQQAQIDTAKATLELNQKKEAREARQGDARISIERQNAARMQQQFDATYGALLGPDGKPLDPEAAKAVAAQDPTAAAIASYKVPPPSLSRGGQSAALMRKVMAINPDYDVKNWQYQAKVAGDYAGSAPGSGGGQMLALNTLIHHADLYMETAKALKNGTFKPGNAVYNAVATAFGAAPPTNAALVARFFASETGKVASGGVPAEGEINGVLKSLGTDASPEAIEGAGKTLLQIAGGRAVPHLEKIHAAHLDNVVQGLGADAKAILQRQGFDPNTMKPISGQQGGYRVGDSVMYQGKPHRIKEVKADGKLVLEQ